MNPVTPSIPIGAAVFWGIITFSILVVLHEGGHFLAARLFGVRVHEFMIGLPGPAIRLKTKSTTFGITAVPLGGYVRIAGMEPGVEDELLPQALRAAIAAGRIDAAALARELGVAPERASRLLSTLADYDALDPSSEDDYSYTAKVEPLPGETAEQTLARVRAWTYRGRKTWQRVLILASGVGVNIVSAILTFTIVLSVWGLPAPSLALGLVQPGSPAARAGLKVGDRVKSVDGKAVSSWDDLLKILRADKPGARVTLTYERRGRSHDVAIVSAGNQGHAYLGVGPSIVYERLGVIRSLTESLRLTGAVFVAIVGFFRGLLQPSQFAATVSQARSIIGISQEAARAAETGPLDYAWLVALLSLSLGAMNILPIPPLDGGKILMELIERVAGHPLRREVVLAASAAGALLLFSLIGYLMYADIVRVITSG